MIQIITRVLPHHCPAPRSVPWVVVVVWSVLVTIQSRRPPHNEWRILLPPSTTIGPHHRIALRVLVMIVIHIHILTIVWVTQIDRHCYDRHELVFRIRRRLWNTNAICYRMMHHQQHHHHHPPTKNNVPIPLSHPDISPIPIPVGWVRISIAAAAAVVVVIF